MGLLDDAIREHLELKRQAGADPGDVAQMEHEALGPVVRGEQPPEAPEVDGHADEPAGEGAGQVTAEELGADPPAGEHHPPEPEPEPEPEPAPQAEHLAPAAAEPEPEHGGATQEFDVEAAHAAERPHEPEPAAPAADQPAPVAGEGKSEDELLEKTPEFLQDTPEHDRLWFEQGPPQEFDFDK